MSVPQKENTNRRKETPIRRRFGTERDVEALTGFSRQTLQKDRLYQRRRFPFYRVRGRILYDLDEVVEIIKQSLVEESAVTDSRKGNRP